MSEETGVEETGIEETKVHAAEVNPELEKSNASREAAKYRRRLRETETELDTLKTQLEETTANHEAALTKAKESTGQLRRVILAHNLPANVDMALVDSLGIDASAVVADDGTVDLEALNTALAPVLTMIRKTIWTPVPNVGQMPERGTVPRSWETAFDAHHRPERKGYNDM